MKEIYIKRGQHLIDVLPTIPTNTLLNKTITGCGATYTEIKCKRDSIIIEPNRPVIAGKCKDPKHKTDNLFGVSEGIYTNNIVDYIIKSRNKNKFIKILTTPESFNKVKTAFEELDIDIRVDGFFLLFDECQKIVKDSDYRPSIYLPLEFFFQCDEKAIISATPPIEFADERLQKFDEIKILPKYDYKQPLSLKTTNNVLQVLKETLENLKEDPQPIFLFINYTDMILALIKQLNLEADSAIFCSEKSMNKLKNLGIKNANTEWNTNKIKRYNFLTSRFYSAVDIEFNMPSIKPNIILITDCFKAEYTMFDPYMDTVQIAGRFRNGISSLTHITNTDSRIQIMTRPQIICKYQFYKLIYESIQTFKNNMPSSICKISLSDCLDALPYNHFLDCYNKENYFIVDNYINDEYIKTFYHDADTLYKRYNDCGYFNIHISKYKYNIGDYEKIKIENKNQDIKKKRQEIVRQLDSLKNNDTMLASEYKRYLAQTDSFIVEAFNCLQKEGIEKLNYNANKIKEAIILKQHEEKATSTDAIKLICLDFKTSHWYSCDYIRERLKAIFKTLNIPYSKAITSHTINDYFEAFEQRKHKGRGYYLVKQRFI